jgi:hypothetical protein
MGNGEWGMVKVRCEEREFLTLPFYLLPTKYWHPAWLKAVGYRCTMFPWIRIGKGHRYVVHHTNYKNLGYERLGRDVVPLSPFAHNFVIHGVLAGFKSAGKQRSYPNLLQRTVHFWCNQRLWFKLLLFLSVLFAGAYSHLL